MKPCFPNQTVKIVEKNTENVVVEVIEEEEKDDITWEE